MKVRKEKKAPQCLSREKTAARTETDFMRYKKAATNRTVADKVAAAETDGVMNEKRLTVVSTAPHSSLINNSHKHQHQSPYLVTVPLILMEGA